MSKANNGPDLTMLAMAAYEAIMRDVAAGEHVCDAGDHQQDDRIIGSKGSTQEVPFQRVITF